MYQGKMLVAHPNLESSIFKNSVLYVYQDNSITTNGLILNKPSTYDLNFIFDAKGFLFDSTEPVYFGGPVGSKSISLLHTNDFSSANTKHISNNISLSSDNFMFEKITTSQGPDQWKMFVGICGWAKGQLDYEIQINNSWLVIEATENLIFDYSGQEQWNKAVECYSQSMFDSYFD